MKQFTKNVPRVSESGDPLDRAIASILADPRSPLRPGVTELSVVPDFGTIEHKWDIAGEGHLFADRDTTSHILLLGAFDDGDDAASLCGDVFQGGDELPANRLCVKCEAIWEKGEL